MIHSHDLAYTDPEHIFRRSRVFSCRRISPQNVQHEVDLAQIFFAYWPYAFARAGSDVDPTYRADMELTVKNFYRVEMDEMTEKVKQLEDTLRKYADGKDTVLFVTLADWRVREALSLTDNKKIFATTLKELINDPWGEVLTNCRGEKARVAMPVAHPGAQATAQPTAEART